MPATHRLDVLVVPMHGEMATVPDRARGVVDALIAAGMVGIDGGPGPRAEAFLPGGFARAWLDVPPGPTLYANQQGGFRASCPACGASVVPVLAPAVRALREGAASAVRCPACAVSTSLSGLVYAPEAAVARFALILADVGGTEVSAEGLALAAAHFGPVRVVLRRPAW